MFLFLDIFLSYFTGVPIFLFLLNIMFIPKKKLAKFVIHSLILDLIFLESYFISTIIGVIIFIIYKKLKINRVTFLNYILSCIIILGVFTVSLGLVNHYSLLGLMPLILKLEIFNLPVYILCYKIFKKDIKLSR